MPKIRARSAAKLNLTLDIFGTMPDGYHEIETLFHTIDILDVIDFELVEADLTSIEIEKTYSYIAHHLPTDGNNLIAKAANAFFSYLDSPKKYRLKAILEKNIPLGAGLAGGSGNAAATLMALNKLLDNPFSLADLQNLGVTLGADVPFCLQGGSAVGRGKGEILEKIDSRLDLTFCIVKPTNISVSTPWAYQAFDKCAGRLPKPAIKSAICGLQNNDLQLAISGFGNVFEPVIFEHYEQLGEIKKQLLKYGALCCHLTGSGPTLYAVVPDRQAAKNIQHQFMQEYETGFFVQNTNSSIEFAPAMEFRIARSWDTGVSLAVNS